MKGMKKDDDDDDDDDLILIVTRGNKVIREGVQKVIKMTQNDPSTKIEKKLAEIDQKSGGQLGR